MQNSFRKGSVNLFRNQIDSENTFLFRMNPVFLALEKVKLKPQGSQDSSAPDSRYRIQVLQTQGIEYKCSGLNVWSSSAPDSMYRI